MKYSFSAEVAKKDTGYAINVPFNVWEVAQQRDEMTAELIIEGSTVDCTLIPVEKGKYEIDIQDAEDLELQENTRYGMILRVPSTLVFLENSPYSYANPVRKIDAIDLRLQSGDGLCGQACVAMITGLSIEDVVNAMNCREWQGTMGKIISALRYYGITHSGVIVYTNCSGKVRLPKCCVMIEKLGRFGHYLVQYDGKFYDPNVGIMEEYDYSKLVGYLEIYI